MRAFARSFAAAVLGGGKKRKTDVSFSLRSFQRAFARPIAARICRARQKREGRTILSFCIPFSSVRPSLYNSLFVAQKLFVAAFSLAAKERRFAPDRAAFCLSHLTYRYDEGRIAPGRVIAFLLHHIYCYDDGRSRAHPFDFIGRFILSLWSRSRPCRGTYPTAPPPPHIPRAKKASQQAAQCVRPTRPSASRVRGCVSLPSLPRDSPRQ